MKAILVLLAVGLLIFGCIQPPVPPGNNTVIPPGYEVKDYCQKDGDCVRLNKCCDCGAGEYVNTYDQQQPNCTGPRCMCAIMDSKGQCIANKCTAVPSIEQSFCGTSTNGGCSSNSDCMKGGCSGQVCQSKNEEPVITTCEYTECYNADTYGVSCGCVGGKCQWQ
ncbi:MAG: eight-cysteine-cluster domain-containing protein [Candidatus Micrarchaeota archaeon]